MFSNKFINPPGILQPLNLPHPEEPMNPDAKAATVNPEAIITQWLTTWEVPAHYWDFWKTAIDIQVYETYPPFITAMGLKQDIPAATWESDGKRHLAIKPKWLNPGVIAHEQAHNSYAKLSQTLKTNFTALYAALKERDQVLKLLFTMNRYGLTSDVEGHAEIYRYIGQEMPVQLKLYYPLLF